MAEFLTKEDGDKNYGSKSKTNAALTLGIIGTALGTGLIGNNGGGDCCCGGGNNGGILGGLFGGNRGNGACCCKAERAMETAMAQGEISQNLSWMNRVKSMQDDFDIHSRSVDRDVQLGNKIADESQLLTNQIWSGRVQDLQEKFDIYARSVASDNAINARICNAENQEKDDKFYLYTQSTQADAALDNKFMKLGYENRIQDLNEKFDLYTRLNNKISDLEKSQAKTETALPLMFELSKSNSERYTDACCCKSEKNLLMVDNNLQRQLDHKIDGELKYAYSNLCAPVPSISPLYCSPFTPNGSGTTWNGCCNKSECNSL